MGLCPQTFLLRMVFVADEIDVNAGRDAEFPILVNSRMTWSVPRRALDGAAPRTPVVDVFQALRLRGFVTVVSPRPALPKWVSAVPVLTRGVPRGLT